MNDLTRIILSMLYKEKLTGYQITKLLESATGNSHQQVYRELNKFPEKGFATVEIEPVDGKPDRKVYTITELGRIAIEEANREPVKTDSFIRSNLDVIILSSLSEDQLVTRLIGYRDEQSKAALNLVTKGEHHLVLRKMLMKAQVQTIDTILKSLKQGD